MEKTQNQTKAKANGNFSNYAVSPAKIVVICIRCGTKYASNAPSHIKPQAMWAQQCPVPDCNGITGIVTEVDF